MSNIKRSELDGSFYTANPMKLKAEIATYYQNADIQKNYNKILGIISPHAGYPFSGPCAAHGFKACQAKNPKTVVVVAPSHQYSHFDYSIGNYDAYETPLGKIDINTELVAKLLKTPRFEFIENAFRGENSMETQIPFIQFSFPKATLVPIIIGNQLNTNSKYLAETVNELLSGKLDETLFVASSDLSHYHDAQTAQKMDSQTAQLIKEKDTKELERLIFLRQIEACGFGPILFLIHLAKMTGYNQVDNLCYSHSGETSYDNAHVVGYLSSVFYK